VDLAVQAAWGLVQVPAARPPLRSSPSNEKWPRIKRGHPTFQFRAKKR
jgi:hypothetical protein